jgi:uncharacterized RDD family membrane protein YckC/ribosomal protein S27AE
MNYQYPPAQNAQPQPPSYRPEVCPLCGNPKHLGKKAKMLYGQWVCGKCRDSFTNRRVFAWIVDVVLFRLAMIPIGAGIVAVLPDNAPRLIVMLCVIPFLLIFCMKDGFTGYSPGKALMGVQVVDARTGRPISFAPSFLRNLPLLIPLMPLIVAFDLMKGKRIGDGWAKTRVIWKIYANRPPFAGLTGNPGARF